MGDADRKCVKKGKAGMVEPSQISVVVLASGLSRRFGPENKLLAPLKGAPLAGYIAQTVRDLPFAQHIAVCASPDVTALFEGFLIVSNIDPAQGQGRSLALGVAAATSPYVLVCLADMPFVTAGHLRALCHAHDGGERATASEAGNYRGPPAILPRHRVLALAEAGDQGARTLLRNAQTLAAPEQTLRDFDTQQDFMC